MSQESAKSNPAQNSKTYLTALGAWALAFGCSVGWGSFVMPGSTFLPIAGPVGTALGLGLGGLVMLIIALNYHYLMNRYPDGGGTYTYTKECFGYDHGFLGAWFLILTYIAIIWANSTALPLIARAVFGDTFQFGFLYEIAGYKIYAGELILAIGALLVAAIICLFRKCAGWTQIIMALILLSGVIICFVVAIMHKKGNVFSPAFVPGEHPINGTFTIFALAPWAYVGFESISHSAAEAKFSLKKSFIIMAVALITAAVAYILLSLLAVTSLPEGCNSWTDYIFNLDRFSGSATQPTFFAAESFMGKWGFVVLGLAALGAIFTGLIGNYIALSRLLYTLSADGMFPSWFGKLSKNAVPKNSIIFILAVSAAFPFLGRTAISWIVDVTTVGATVAYALASASAFKAARGEGSRMYKVSGIVGLVISLLFAIEFLIPNLISVKTLSTESYMILAIWSICGFLYFRLFLRRDKKRRLGHSIVAWVVLLGLIIFTSSVWMRQTTDIALEKSINNVETEFFSDTDSTDPETASTYIQEQIHSVVGTMNRASLIQIFLIIFSLIILLDIYSILQKREKQIEVEKALAEESSRAKTSFLSNMSHEIRTPMNAIIGLDNIALRDPDINPRTRDHLEKIGASARHLLGLINDILDMSRIESGRIVLKNEEFSFSEFLEQINIIINGQCQDKGLDYECNIEGHVNDYYFGDDMKLKQIMINILGNAVKFTNAPGKVTFSVQQLTESEGLCTLRFIMKDTGIGMDKEYISKIFETFSQEDSTNTNKYGGSGLGMAITKNFVEMMNGDIDVESEKGVGTTFTVTVSLKASDRTADADTFTEEAKETITATLTGRRILLAEDMAQNVEILADLLELEGMESEYAENGELAVKMFSDSEPGYYDAILMDVRMPVMDGLSATRAIRALEREDAKTIPIIAMTANVFDEDVEQSLKAGMNAHLSKPIEPDRLYETIAHLLNK